MNVNALRRGEGKTTKLLEQFLAADGYFIADTRSSLQWAKALLARAHPELPNDRLREIKNRMFSYEQVRAGALRGQRARPVFIDDAEQILRDLFAPFDIAAVSITHGEG
jgi:hypothetical protein